MTPDAVTPKGTRLYRHDEVILRGKIVEAGMPVRVAGFNGKHQFQRLTLALNDGTLTVWADVWFTKGGVRTFPVNQLRKA